MKTSSVGRGEVFAGRTQEREAEHLREQRRATPRQRWRRRLAAGVCASVVAWGCGGTNGTPATPQTIEARVRAELGVPPTAARVLILSQSSHLDWDWLHTFDDYFQLKVDPIFMDALQLLTQYHAAPAHYFYAVAEVGYLQRFVAVHPELLQPLQQVGEDLRIVGGGITSPDNLLPPGEAFIRDYLVGKTWVDETLGLPIRQAWLPDDFGHDAQLPIVLEAMGFEGVGFARVPGVDTTAHFLGFTATPPQSLAAQLLRQGIDFVWQARDGSETLAHWMPATYCQGDPLVSRQLMTTDDIQRILALNGPASPTPYIFVPIGCDFAAPKVYLLDLVSAWNAQQYAQTGVWAVAATFDHYEQLVDAHRDALLTRRFDPTPYWTGFYASRPLLKSLHLRATQALLGAEIFGAVADAAWRDDEPAWLGHVRARTAAINAGWATLVPGNHHDFITGTALDPVYQDEQVPRLTDALAQGEALRNAAMGEIAGAIAPQRTGERTVVVFNQLGFARHGLVEIREPVADLLPDVMLQPSAEGGTLFVAQMPSLGYATIDQAAAPAGAPVSLTLAADGASVVLENAALRATISRDTGWSLISVVDKQTDTEMIASGAPANVFRIYDDDGGLYRFGDEMKSCSLTPESDAVAASVPGDLSILEAGPLRSRVTADVTIAGHAFEKEYQLVAGEPFLRMRSTGAAPDGTSVMTHFPLAGPVDDLVYGTPYHWDDKPPARAGALTFEATHDFVILRDHGTPRGALFHAGLPAWAAQPDGTVIGTLWRNAHQERCDLYGASGSDADDHTVDYALRVASDVAGPETGQPLQEALAFQVPLQAIVGTPSGTLPRSRSLASVAPTAAIITAAKTATADPETLVLRVYQPTNATLNVSVRTTAASRFPPSWRLALEGRTALESELPASSVARLALSGTPDGFGFVAARALTTVTIGRSTTQQ